VLVTPSTPSVNVQEGSELWTPQITTVSFFEHHLLSKEIGLAGLRPASPCATIRAHKGCYTPPVHGLGRAHPAETTFISNRQKTGHASGRFHYWLPEGQVTAIEPSVHRLRDLTPSEKRITPTVHRFPENDQRLTPPCLLPSYALLCTYVNTIGCRCPFCKQTPGLFTSEGYTTHHIPNGEHGWLDLLHHI
jgi:hypothetical protein